MIHAVDYTALTLAEVSAGLADVSRQTDAVFGAFNGRQLNWRPDTTRWSVAQCFEHMLTTGRLMRLAAEDALNGARPRSIWQRLPLWSRLLGPMMIRSQAPATTRKFTAPPAAQPPSEIPADVIQRFGEHVRDAAAWVQALDEQRAARAIMTSPFVRVVTYSVLDGCRLMMAHDHRHFEQARRVTEVTAFPRA